MNIRVDRARRGELAALQPERGQPVSTEGSIVIFLDRLEQPLLVAAGPHAKNRQVWLKGSGLRRQQAHKASLDCLSESGELASTRSVNPHPHHVYPSFTGKDAHSPILHIEGFSSQTTEPPDDLLSERIANLAEEPHSEVQVFRLHGLGIRSRREELPLQVRQATDSLFALHVNGQEGAQIASSGQLRCVLSAFFAFRSLERVLNTQRASPPEFVSQMASEAPGHGSKFVVCVTGMPGAGKSTVAKAIAKLGFHVVNLGDAVREETARRQLEPTDANIGAVMVKLRERLGPGAIAELSLPKVTSPGHEYVVVDGVRGIEEVNVFKRVGAVKLLAVHAAQPVRFHFLRSRGRLDAPLSWELFEARDQRELAVGVGEAIALADEIISNNAVTIDELQDAAVRIVRRWMGAAQG